MAIPLSQNLTGAYRLRRTLFGKMILQVEVNTGLDVDYSTISGEEKQHTEWVDASANQARAIQLETSSFVGQFKGLLNV